MTGFVTKLVRISTAISLGALAAPSVAATIVTTGTAGTTGATALYLTLPAEISASQAITDVERNSFLGRPNDTSTGIGGQFVTYDLGNYRFFNGSGQDFNVYEADNGFVEFNRIDVLVSADGTNFFNVEGTALAALDYAGDELHSNASFRRSYDLGGAVAALGTNQFRYLRIAGTGTGDITGGNFFDLEAVGFGSFALAQSSAVPEPATWAMMIGGFGMVGGSMRYRRRKTSIAYA